MWACGIFYKRYYVRKIPTLEKDHLGGLHLLFNLRSSQKLQAAERSQNGVETRKWQRLLVKITSPTLTTQRRRRKMPHFFLLAPTFGNGKTRTKIDMLRKKSIKHGTKSSFSFTYRLNCEIMAMIRVTRKVKNGLPLLDILLEILICTFARIWPRLATFT